MTLVTILTTRGKCVHQEIMKEHKAHRFMHLLLICGCRVINTAPGGSVSLEHGDLHISIDANFKCSDL